MLEIRILFLIVLTLKAMEPTSNNKLQVVDSLKNEFNHTQNDRVRVLALVCISQIYSSYNLKPSICEEDRDDGHCKKM